MKKIVSVILALIMVLSIFAVMPLSASAALDENKVYIEADGKYYEVEKDQMFTYMYCLNVPDLRISALDARTYYDTEGLDFVPDVDEYGDDDLDTMFPITKSNTVFNYNKDGELLYNYTAVKGVRFPTENSVVFTGKFKVTADSGVYSIYSQMYTLADTDMNKIAYLGEKIGEYYESAELPELEAIELPTDEPTELPTDEPTGLPTDEPTNEPTQIETDAPTEDPSAEPTELPTVEPTDEPTDAPTVAPTEAPTTETKQATLYVINSANWKHVLWYAWVDDDHVNAMWPGEFMYDSGVDAPNGADVYTVTADDPGYKYVVFVNEGVQYTEDLVFTTDKYYDNATGIWYDSLSDVPTEAPTEDPSEEPTESPTTENFVFINADDHIYQVKQGDIFTYVFNLGCSEKVCSLDASTYYDNSGLEFLPTLDEYGDIDVEAMFPNITSAVYNFEVENMLYYNYISTTGKNFPVNENGEYTEKNKVIVAQFRVVAQSGTYEISSMIKTLGDSNADRIIFDYEIKRPDVQITTMPEITDVIPVEPTEAPTDAPTESETLGDADITVLLCDEGNWGDVYAYAFLEQYQNALWPGVRMTKIEDYTLNGADLYYIMFDKSYKYIIFSSGLSNNHTEDLPLYDGYIYNTATLTWESYIDFDQDFTPTVKPTDAPTDAPTDEPTEAPTTKPTQYPTYGGDEGATDAPTVDPSVEPTESPTVEPTEAPTAAPTEAPTAEPTEEPTDVPTEEPSKRPGSSDDSTEDPSEGVEDPTEPPTEGGLYGDINGDGKVSIADVTYIQKHLAQYDTHKELSDVQKTLGDVNRDGKISVADATKIQKFLAYWITEL